MATAAFAWFALWLGDRAPYGRYLEHESAAGEPLALPLFLTAWLVMLFATLVPTMFPLFGAFRRVVARRADRGRLQARLLGGVLAVWLAFGYAAFVADSLLHAAVDSVPWLAGRPQLIAAGVLATAGVFQLTSLKERCLAKCRSPESFLFRHWGGARPPGREAARVGIAYGVSCVGCCWALMLLMFAFALGSLAWMAVLAFVMAVEKDARAGMRLARPVGVALLAAAVAVLALG